MVEYTSMVEYISMVEYNLYGDIQFLWCNTVFMVEYPSMVLYTVHGGKKTFHDAIHPPWWKKKFYGAIHYYNGIQFPWCSTISIMKYSLTEYEND
jgi:hypothetical protein